MRTIELGGKTRPIKMKMLAVKEYRKLTGKNLAGGDADFIEIMGDKKTGVEFNPDYFVAFLFAVLKDGAHPEVIDFTVDDVASWVNLYDKTLVGQLFELYMEEMTGKTAEEILKEIEQNKKNLPAPQDGASDGVGMMSSDLLTAV